MSLATEIAGGILLALVYLSLIGSVLAGIVNWARRRYWLGADMTDDHINQRRSGVSIVTDYGTGRQYLVTPKGGITPRLHSLD